MNWKYLSVSLVKPEPGGTRRICDYTVRGHFLIWPMRFSIRLRLLHVFQSWLIDHCTIKERNERLWTFLRFVRSSKSLQSVFVTVKTSDVSLANHKTGFEIILDQSRLNQIRFPFSNPIGASWNCSELIATRWSCLHIWIELLLNFGHCIWWGGQWIYSCIILTVPKSNLDQFVKSNSSQNRLKIVLYIFE